MFDPHCESCGHRVLLGPRRVLRIIRTPEGPVVRLRCHCAAEVVWPAAPPIPVGDDARTLLPAP